MGCIFIHDDYPITVGLGQFSEYTGLKCCICDVLFDMSSLMYFIAKPFRLYLNHLDFHLFFISFQKCSRTFGDYIGFLKFFDVQGILSASVLSIIPLIRPYQWQSLLMPV